LLSFSFCWKEKETAERRMRKKPAVKREQRKKKQRENISIIHAVTLKRRLHLSGANK